MLLTTLDLVVIDELQVMELQERGEKLELILSHLSVPKDERRREWLSCRPCRHGCQPPVSVHDPELASGASRTRRDRNSAPFLLMRFGSVYKETTASTRTPRSRTLSAPAAYPKPLAITLQARQHSQ